MGKPEFCDTDPSYKFPDGKTGFQVRYRQDHSNYPGKPGRESRYIVKHGLSLRQKKQVALAIFMEVSHRFEKLQNLFSFVTDSGYSQEDLVSNLIGFYIGIGEIDKITALQLCHPISATAAFNIWDSEGAVGKNKNTNWQPRYAQSSAYTSKYQCIDECSLVKKEFPKEFQSIEPANKGDLFKERYITILR